MRVASIAAILLSVASVSTLYTNLTSHRTLLTSLNDDVDEDNDDTAGRERPASVTLVVGGTDGSGTRSVVSLLDRLGVPISADDAETLDTHAKEMGGWPETVRSVLTETHSADYEVADLSAAVRDEIMKRIERFWLSKGRGFDRHMPRASLATDVTWAFKAPVSMLLVPLFVEVARQSGDGGVKFLHVVRDGRDIAYSDNQSPVTKFYNLSFPAEGGGIMAKPVMSAKGAEIAKRSRAIELWSAWNTQLLSWERRTVGGKASSPTYFDFLVLHVEDLVSPDVNIRRAAIASVAKFVGSPVDDLDICCLATEETRSLGSHTKTFQSMTSAVESRYGKWKKRASAEMITTLNEVGLDGLDAFGYDPHVRAADQIFPPPNALCDADACRDWEAPPRLVARLAKMNSMKRKRRRKPGGSFEERRGRKREMKQELRNRIKADGFGVRPRIKERGQAEERRRRISREKYGFA